MPKFIVEIPKQIDAFLERSGLKTEDPEIAYSDSAAGVTVTLFWSSAPAAVPGANGAPFSGQTLEQKQPSTETPDPEPVVIKEEPHLPSEKESKRRLQKEERGTKDLAARPRQQDSSPVNKRRRTEPSTCTQQTTTTTKKRPAKKTKLRKPARSAQKSPCNAATSARIQPLMEVRTGLKPVPRPKCPPCIPGEPRVIQCRELYYTVVRCHGDLIIEANWNGILTSVMIDGVDPRSGAILTKLQSLPKFPVFRDLKNTILHNVYDFVLLQRDLYDDDDEYDRSQ